MASFVCAALAYAYLPGNWYVLIGALSGIASAFWLIQEDDA
ncbi:azaleucine resistance protein AzlC [Acinetobacter sp. HR7]|nr:azaleucine resistance protein AzlC [Acinetobacter sp. HR7]